MVVHNSAMHPKTAAGALERDAASGPGGAATRSAVLRARDVCKRYGETPVVKNVSFALYQGEVLTLLGPSGCGKSTTLRLVAGLEAPDAGEVELYGQTVAAPERGVFIPAERRNVGLVFQSYAIWPHLTVAGNIAYPLEIRRQPARKIRAKVEEMLALVGLEGLGPRPATNLSGGQQQRVALARALAYEPHILLLDEPLSNLDAKLRHEMRTQLQSLRKRLGTTILYVTHDQVEAMALSDRVAVMRDGRIEQLGTPVEIYENPVSYFVQSFVGTALNFDGHVRQTAAGPGVKVDGAAGIIYAEGPLPPTGTAVRLTTRPEALTFVETATGPNVLVATVKDLTYCGGHWECTLAVGAGEITLNVPPTFVARPGARLFLHLDPVKVKTWPR